MTPPKKKSTKAAPKPLARNAKKKLATNQDITALAGLLTARSRFAQRAGLQFGGKRDLYQVAGYVASGREQFMDYWGLYRRNEIAGRIVDMPARTTWKTPPEISEDGSPKGGTALIDQFTKLAKRLQLWKYFEKADRLSGVGRYSILVLGTRGTSAEQLKTPLTRLGKPEDLIYLQAYHEGNALITKWVTETGNERFGLPEMYQVTLSAGVPGFDAQQTRIHASRVLHVAQDPLEDDVFGRPRLQQTLNRIFDLDKIAASVGESYWQGATRILQAVIDKEAEIDGPAMDTLDDRLTEMIHDLRRQFTGQGAKLEWLPVDVPDPKSIGDFYFSLIAAGSGIPKRILFGSELGELASSTDQEAYFGMINERQERFAEPALVREFIDRLVKFGALPPPGNKDDGYEVVWPTLFEESEDVIAAANLKRAQTAAALTPVGGDPLHLVEIDEERNVWLIPREPAPQERDLVIPLSPEDQAAADLEAAKIKADAMAKANPKPNGNAPADGSNPNPPNGGTPAATGAAAGNRRRASDRFVWQPEDLIIEEPEVDPVV